MIQSIPYASVFAQAARRYGIPTAILTAVAQHESGFNPAAVNHDSNGTEDVGIMQLNLQAQGVTHSFAANPVTAIPYAARLLADLHHQYGTWARALSAYNSGSPTGSPTYAQAVLGIAGQQGSGASATAHASDSGARTLFGQPLTTAISWIRIGAIGLAAAVALLALSRL